MDLPYGLNGELDHVFRLSSPAEISGLEGERSGTEDGMQVKMIHPVLAMAVMGHRIVKYLRHDGTLGELALLDGFDHGKAVAVVPPRNRLEKLYQLIKLWMACRSVPPSFLNRWRAMHRDSRRLCAARVAARQAAHLCSLAVVVFGGGDALEATLRSVEAQTVSPWKCFLAARLGQEALSMPLVEPTPEAFKAAGASHVWTLEAGDELEPDAVEIAQAYLSANPSADCLYCDEIRDTGHGVEHMFKPEYDPILLEAFDYIGRSRIVSVPFVRERTPAGGDYRSVDPALAGSIVHVPHQLLRSGPVLQAGREAVSGGDAPNRPSVSIIIPTRDNTAMLKSCLTSVMEKTDYPGYEIIVVDNGSRCPETLDYLSALQDTGTMVLRADMEFNYSLLNNMGGQNAHGELLVFLNDDVEVVEPGWLAELAAWAVRPDIGSVGAELLYPGGLLQHAGVVLGMVGVAGHPWKGVDPEGGGATFQLRHPRTVSANTGACMAVEKSKFEAVGGFDEQLAVAFNDVDFCLRLQRAGLRNVWTPCAVLVHHESASRGGNDTRDKRLRFQEEKKRMFRRWPGELANDPYYNPNLTYEVEDGGLALFPGHMRS